MDFEALKQLLKQIEIARSQEEKKGVETYYRLPCAKIPFEGRVIRLSGDEFDYLFQRYGWDEGSFRRKLERMDAWFYDKPHRVQQNAINYIAKWLTKEEQERYT